MRFLRGAYKQNLTPEYLGTQYMLNIRIEVAEGLTERHRIEHIGIMLELLDETKRVMHIVHSRHKLSWVLKAARMC